MRHARLVMGLLLGLCTLCSPLAMAGETMVTGRLTLAVAQPEQTADALVHKTDEEGGWFRSRAPGNVSLAVPRDAFDELLAFAEEQGLVLERSLSRQDASQQLVELRGRLTAREALLDSYKAVLVTAGPNAILTVESEMTSAIAQIEELRGQIGLLEHQAAHATLDVAFQFPERAAPARDGTSSFAWLNTLNVQDVVSNSVAAVPPYRTTRGTVSTPPEGFADWRDERHYRAISSDGVLFQVRTMEQEPDAELAFWQEAVRERMLAAGYRVLGERPIAASGVEGALLELAAPLGTTDWLYWVAFFPKGKRLVIAEAAGEIPALDARRDAVLAALQSLSP